MLGSGDLRQLTGAAAPDVLALLATLSSGHAGRAAALWQEWRDRHIVSDTGHGEWRFTHAKQRALDDVEELIAARLEEIYGVDLPRVATAGVVLECAALEGARFTAPAIAMALGRDVDETIDLLDDTLLADGQRPRGFVTDQGFLRIQDERGSRHLARYSFTRTTDWLAFGHVARLAPGGGRDLRRRLARALEACYGGAATGIAPTLRRLFAEAGDTDRASYYQRMSTATIGAAIVLWRARLTLEADPPRDRLERRRAYQALIDASDMLFHGGPFDEALTFALGAVNTADHPADHATASYNAGCHEISRGEYVHARTHVSRALEIGRELGDRNGEAAALHELAVIERAQGRYEPAREQFTRVLKIRRELGDHRGEVECLRQLDQLGGSG